MSSITVGQRFFVLSGYNVNVAVARPNEPVGHYGAFLLKKRCEKNPPGTMGLLTGGTAEPFYQALVGYHNSGELDLTTTPTYNLDEYAGIEFTHPASYHAQMKRWFFDPIGKPERICFFPGVDNWHLYDSMIRLSPGPRYLVCGIGPKTAHLAFCEPGTSFKSQTHEAKLSEETRQANARFFDGDVNKVPKSAWTMGLETIVSLFGGGIMVLAGESKEAEVVRAITGGLEADCPASCLRLHKARHGHSTPEVTYVVAPSVAAALAEAGIRELQH